MTDSAKLEADLRTHLRGLGSAIIALSGGVDSSLLAAVASEELGERALTITATSPVFPAHELADAEAVARQCGIAHRLMPVDILDREVFATNPPDRCYHCKLVIFGGLVEVAKAEGFAAIIDGSNVDDAGDYRPGVKALAELGIISPLRECGYGKEAIRAFSRRLKLPTSERPSCACLASRVPYGEAITLAKVEAIAAGEAFLRERGFEQSRVRHHGKLARVEVPAEQIAEVAGPMRDELVAHLRSLGFTWVTLDLVGYRTGSLNESLDNK